MFYSFCSQFRTQSKLESQKTSRTKKNKIKTNLISRTTLFIPHIIIMYVSHADRSDRATERPKAQSCQRGTCQEEKEEEEKEETTGSTTRDKRTYCLPPSPQSLLCDFFCLLVFFSHPRFPATRTNEPEKQKEHRPQNTQTTKIMKTVICHLLQRCSQTTSMNSLVSRTSSGYCARPAVHLPQVSIFLSPRCHTIICN